MKKLLYAFSLVALFVSTGASAIEVGVNYDHRINKTAPQKMKGMSTADMKAHILMKLAERKSKLNQKVACVEAAQDRSQLRACHPKRGKHKDLVKQK